jgi:uncharacterized pyridoxal phosphate-containing UPF0001 family protein
MIQSVDSVRLAAALSRRVERFGRTLPVLLEVKTDPGPSKHGVAPEEACDVFSQMADMPGLSPLGLMTIAPWTQERERLRGSFATLKRLMDAVRAKHPEARVLSMGMSDDLEIAVEEGSTMVRVGRALTA